MNKKIITKEINIYNENDSIENYDSIDMIDDNAYFDFYKMSQKYHLAFRRTKTSTYHEPYYYAVTGEYDNILKFVKEVYCEYSDMNEDEMLEQFNEFKILPTEY